MFPTTGSISLGRARPVHDKDKTCPGAGHRPCQPGYCTVFVELTAIPMTASSNPGITRFVPDSKDERVPVEIGVKVGTVLITPGIIDHDRIAVLCHERVEEVEPDDEAMTIMTAAAAMAYRVYCFFRFATATFPFSFSDFFMLSSHTCFPCNLKQLSKDPGQWPRDGTAIRDRHNCTLFIHLQRIR